MNILMKKQYKRYISISISILLCLIAVTGVWAVTVVPWFWASPVTNVSRTQNVQANVSLAIDGDNIGVVWSGGESAPGIYLAENSGFGWTRSALTSTINRATRFPKLVLDGSEPIVVWSQSETIKPADSQAQTLLQQDGTDSAVAVAGPVYGRVAPDLALASTGLHMVFPAATAAFVWSKHDLYYTHRYLASTTWSAPTVVVTHTQVIPNFTSGKIWYPELAVSSDGQTVHAVWEQSGQSPPQPEILMVWYISGTWNSGSVLWGTPIRISPAYQDYAVRPSVGVDTSGNVHIAWTELIPGSGGTTNPDAQHINYIQLGDSFPTRINVDPIKVNSNSPTWASSALAINDHNICVSWHGFYEGETTEDIFLRCSENQGVTWRPLINISESNNYLSDFPDMEFDDEGLLHSAWEEREIDLSTYEPLDIYYRGGEPHHYTIYFPLVTR